MHLPQGKTDTCTLHDVLLLPDLTYNHLSITCTSKRGKVTTFTDMRCEIRNSKSKLIQPSDTEKGVCTTLTKEVLFIKPVQALIKTVSREQFGTTVMGIWELKE